MSKRRLSHATIPPAKRLHNQASFKQQETLTGAFDDLSDEVVLIIFAYLSWRNLCTIQSTNSHWARLAIDNELWKLLFINEFGRLRLRGSHGVVTRHETREIKPLPHGSREEDIIDWKWMFRISSNWRRGRCELENIEGFFKRATSDTKAPYSCTLLLGPLVVTTLDSATTSPPIHLNKRGSPPYSLLGSHRTQVKTHITALCIDQSRPTIRENTSRLAAFYDTGDFTIFSIDRASPQRSRRLMSYFPFAKTDRTSPIRQAVYHHPLLVTLSHAFHLSLYELKDDDILHSQTLTSFTSFPPTSMVLTPGINGYRLVLAYSAPVYPSHWNAAVTILTISSCSSTTVLSDTADKLDDVQPRRCAVTSSRTVRAYDCPGSWLSDKSLRLMREQWGRKAARVADTQTDGKWVILAPADAIPRISVSRRENSYPLFGSTACAMQLYRLHVSNSASGGTGSLRMTFVRTLHGHKGPVAALALADGRCVSLGVDGSIWVWDLERGSGTEIQSPRPLERKLSSIKDGLDESEDDSDDDTREPFYIPEDIPMGTPMGAVAFDERRIVTTGVYGIEARRFDI